jgi:hypothetical protein
MTRKPRTVHVSKITNTVKGVTYTSYYLRRSFRADGKVQHETLGNLSDLPLPVIDLIRRSLKGETFVPAAEVFRNVRSRPHGHVQAILTMIRRLGLDATIASQPSRRRDLVLALIAQRLLSPCSKLATTRHWHDTTLAEELHVQDATDDDLHAAMDRLLPRQKTIETKLARRHLTEGGLVLYDVSSSYYEGGKCPLARRGHDRDGKTGRPILVYGVLGDASGRPVAVQVYPGDTGDPTTVPDQVAKLSGQFGLSRIVLVGDPRPAHANANQHVEGAPRAGLDLGAAERGDPRPARGWSPEPLAVRRGEPGRDRLAGLSRGAALRLLQPAPGGEAGAETRGVAGGDGGEADEAGPWGVAADQGRAVGGGDRREGGAGDRAAQDGQAPPADDR